MKKKELRKENNVLKNSLENLQRLFDKLIKFLKVLKDRMFNKKEKYNYYDFSVDLYTYVIINDDKIKDIKDKDDNAIERNSRKRNDDFEL